MPIKKRPVSSGSSVMENHMTLKSKAIVGALAALGLVLGTASALAAPAYTTGSVNVRTGPGTNFTKLGSLARGQYVDVRQCTDGWCYVVSSGPNGWVSANYLANANWNSPPPRPLPVPPPYPRWDDNEYAPPIWGPPRKHHKWNRGQICFNGPYGYFCVGN